MSFLILFTILSLINVILSTFKSIATIKCGKALASLINAGYYGFYNIILVMTVQDFPMWQKVTITIVTNLVGIYIAKWFEEKIEKVKLWKFELTIENEKTILIHDLLEKMNIPHNYIPNIGKYTMFQVYCSTKEESKNIRKIAASLKAKLFATNSLI